MTSVILNEGGSVIEHDEVIYPNEAEHEHHHEHGKHEHDEKHEKHHHGKTYKVILHFH